MKKTRANNVLACQVLTSPCVPREMKQDDMLRCRQTLRKIGEGPLIRHGHCRGSRTWPFPGRDATRAASRCLAERAERGREQGPVRRGSIVSSCARPVTI
jgi:hypothetical protein